MSWKTAGWLVAGLAMLVGVDGVPARAEAVVWISEGDVRMENAESGLVQPVFQGAVIPDHAKLMTAPGGSCTIEYTGARSGAVVRLDEQSVAVVGPEAEPALELREGSMLAKLRQLPEGSRFEVKTPTAIAAVRGTGWMQTSERIEVYEGRVALIDAYGAETPVATGEVYTTQPGGVYTRLPEGSAIGQDRWRQWVTRVEEYSDTTPVRAEDLLALRRMIDAKRADAACGSAGAYPWSEPIEAGRVISLSLVNEMRSALTQAPFDQNAGWRSRYIDSVPELRSGERIRRVHLKWLEEAASAATC